MIAGDEPEVDPDDTVWLTPATIGDEPVHRAEVLLSVVLRTGVLICVVLVLLGLVLALLAPRLALPGGVGSPLEAAAYPTTLSGILAGIRAGQPTAFIALGLAVLILTPIVNVVLSLVAFVLDRDWAFVVVSALILVLIAVGFLVNAATG